MDFTDQELFIISEGLINLMQNAVKAKTLINDPRTHIAITEYFNKLQNLNSKVSGGKEHEKQNIIR